MGVSRASARFAVVSKRRDGCLLGSSVTESPEKLRGHREIIDSFIIEYTKAISCIERRESRRRQRRRAPRQRKWMSGWSQFKGLCQHHPWPVHAGWHVLVAWKVTETGQILFALIVVSNFCDIFIWNSCLLIKIFILGKTGGSVCKNKNLIQCLLI